MIRQDFLERAIKQLGAALSGAAGLRRQNPALALEVLKKAKGELPLVPGLLERTAPAQLRALLSSPELSEQLASLYELESQLHKQRGDTRAALASLQRCAALREV